MASLVNPRYLGKVENVLAVSEATPWYGDLVTSAKAFQADLHTLADALAAGNVEAAAEAGHAIHESQHALSHATYHWLGTLSGLTASADAVVAAQDIIDSTGFLGMAEEIEAAETMADVNPRSLGKVQKALAVARAVTWPDTSGDQAQAFKADAEALVKALDAGDLAGAKTAAEAIHGSQHDLSHGVYEWASAEVQDTPGTGAIVKAIDIIDSTGFHGMGHEIEKAETMADVNPRNLSKVRKALTVAQMAAWPDELVDQVQAFTTDAEFLAKALDTGDLAGAKAAAKAVHGSQHDLSHGVYEWLGSEEVAAGTSVDNAETTTASVEETEHTQTESSTAADQYADAELVNVEVSDWGWDFKTLTLTEGEPVVLEITNTGEMPHGIWVPQLAINTDAPPGEVVRVKVMPEETGEFTLMCNNPMCGTGKQHADMVAKVVVTN